MAETIYGHKPLKIGRFRLLELHPGHVSQPLVCGLSEEPLDTSFEFEALSYTWGDISNTTTVYLCGQDWPVTLNLAAALRHLRYEEKPRALWVDAICIIQVSNPERTHQVAQMCRIYEQATRVLVWVGEGSEEKNLAIDAMEIMAMDKAIHWYANEHCGEPSIETRYPKFRKGNYVASLQDLVSSSWWGRVWTLQEAVLARDLTFVSGWRSFPFDVLLKVRDSYALHTLETKCCRLLRFGSEWNMEPGVFAVTQLEFLRTKRGAQNMRVLRGPNTASLILDPSISAQSGILPEHREGRENIVTLHTSLLEEYDKFMQLHKNDQSPNDSFRQRQLRFFQTRDELRECHMELLVDCDKTFEQLRSPLSLSNFNHFSPWNDLIDLMHEARLRECTDPRDRIYGFSGLRGGICTGNLLPDYSFPAYKIFEDFQLEAICRNQSLDILSLLYPWNVQTDITWLVNWGIRDFNMRSVLRERLLHLPLFQASMGIYQKALFLHPQALCVRGFIFDLVGEVGEAHIVEGDAWRKYRSWWMLLGLDKRFHHPYPNGGSRASAFCQTLMGYSGRGQEGIVDNARFFEPHLRRHIEGNGDDIPEPKKKQKSSQRRRLSKFLSKAPKASKDPSENTTALSLLGHALTATHYRQLVISKKGYIGLANIGVQEGDWICIIYGARMPFVLRNDTEEPYSGPAYGGRPRYRVVGDAYVHGLMQGEGLNMLEKRKATELEFLLV